MNNDTFGRAQRRLGPPAETDHTPIAPSWPTKRERAAAIAAKRSRALCDEILHEARDVQAANELFERRAAELFVARAVVAGIRQNVDDYYERRISYEVFSNRNRAFWELPNDRNMLVCALLRDDHADVAALINAIE